MSRFEGGWAATQGRALAEKLGVRSCIKSLARPPSSPKKANEQIKKPHVPITKLCTSQKAAEFLRDKGNRAGRRHWDLEPICWLYSLFLGILCGSSGTLG